MDFTFKAMSPWRSVLLGCRKLTQFVLPSLFLQMVQIGMDIRQHIG